MAVFSSDYEVFLASVKAHDDWLLPDNTVSLFCLIKNFYNRNDELMRNSEGYFRGNAVW
jgi:hypothetical protein